jgi:putative restriction endonuclease
MTQGFPLKTMKSQGVRALNKPITLLWLIGQYYLFERTEFHFLKAEEVLKDIIRDYTGNPNVVDPFWRLQNDGILFFSEADKVRISKSGGPSIVDLRIHGHAVFTKSFLRYIQNPDRLIFYCESLLSEYFTESFEQDILYRTGLNYRDSYLKSSDNVIRRKRDPKFREVVGTAYNHQCAVCRFYLMLGGSPITNEAAHIKWHAYEGPDSVNNGLLLCNLHHNLFDRGVFTFTEDYTLSVSDKVSSMSDGFIMWILEYENHEIILPRKTEWYPSQDFLNWHRKNVFIK